MSMTPGPLARQAYDGFRALGYGHDQSAGLVGNLLQESGARKGTTFDIRPGVDTGDNGNSYGSVQWNGPRKRSYLKWAEANKFQPNDVIAQVLYTVHELNTTEKKARKAFDAKDPETIAVELSRRFWRPSDPREDNRARYARMVADTFQGGDATLTLEGNPAEDVIDSPKWDPNAYKEVLGTETSPTAAPEQVAEGPAKWDPNAYKEFLEAPEPGAAVPMAGPDTPPEMVYDPDTGQMVDTLAVAEGKAREGGIGYNVGAAASQFVKGTLGAGSYADEIAGAVGGERARKAWLARDQVFERDNPKTSFGLQMGGGLTSGAALAVGMGATGLGTAGSLARRSIVNMGLGAGVGAVEGTAYGYGEGVDDPSREAMAKSRGVVGAALGAGLGLVSPAIGDGITKVSKYVVNKVTGRQGLAALGMSPEAGAIVHDALRADNVLGDAEANLLKAGPNAMPAQSGPSSTALLDQTINSGGSSAAKGQRAVRDLEVAERRSLMKALDDALGDPKGYIATQREISDSTRPARNTAYDKAFSVELPYETPKGEAVTAVLERIPKKDMQAAIAEANAEMQAFPEKYAKQILVKADDEGVLEFIEVPNVYQLDQIKRALDRSAERNEFGYLTEKGRRPAALAKALRDAIKDANDDYATALSAGADKLARENALKMGTTVFNRAVTREQVELALKLATPAERDAMKTGARRQIDETIANVRASMADETTDAKEAWAALSLISSPAAREKLAMIINNDAKSASLQSAVDSARAAFRLRTGITRGSPTEPRQQVAARKRELLEPGIMKSVFQLSPLTAARKFGQAMTGASPEERKAILAAFDDEIVTALTGPRGPKAFEFLQELEKALTQSDATREVSKVVGRRLAVGAALTGYEGARQVQNGAYGSPALP